MANCPKCGAPVNEGVKFCSKCGANLMASTAPTPQPIKQPATQPSQGYSQPIKKSKTPLIIGLVVAVVAIVVVILLILLLTGGGVSGDEAKLVGTWEYSMEMGDFGEYNTAYVFNSDKSWEVGYAGSTPTKVGTWKIEDNKLVLSATGLGTEYSAGTYTYKFSNNDQKLTLGMNGINIMTFTKTG